MSWATDFSGNLIWAKSSVHSLHHKLDNKIDVGIIHERNMEGNIFNYFFWYLCKSKTNKKYGRLLNEEYVWVSVNRNV